jgi:hypothetical protein
MIGACSSPDTSLEGDEMMLNLRVGGGAFCVNDAKAFDEIKTAVAGAAAGTLNTCWTLRGRKPRRAKRFARGGIAFAVDGHINRVPMKQWGELLRCVEIADERGGDAEFGVGIHGVWAE